MNLDDLLYLLDRFVKGFVGFYLGGLFAFMIFWKVGELLFGSCAVSC